jgi:uncharacterized protein (TIGR02996 family)
VTSEDDFHRALDARPDGGQTRLVFADWLQERGDPRADGYRAIAIQRRRPLDSPQKGKTAWWWHCHPSAEHHNVVASDWFTLLPANVGSKLFWPLITETGGIKSRRECEDALASAFAQLPPERQTELLNAPRPADGKKEK